MHTEQEIDAFLSTIPGGRVLDVATGAGAMIGWIVEALRDVEHATGIDMIDLDERATRANTSIFEREDVTFTQMDAHQMTFSDASFDTVTIANSLHHLDDPPRVLAECARVLKPGGHLIVQEMVSDNLTEAQQSHRLLHHWFAAVDTALGITHHETFTRDELVALVDALGLAEVRYFDYANLESDPKRAELRSGLQGHIDRYLERAQDLPVFAEIERQARAIESRLDAVGFHGATALIAVGRKAQADV